MKKTAVFSISLLLFFALSPLLFPYNPPLEAVDAYETHHVTNTTYFGNLAKNFQDLTEQKPCTYEILGWDQDNNLYYRSVCRSVSETYAYSPAIGTNSLSSKIPEELTEDAYPDAQLLEMVRAAGVRPKIHEPYTRPLYLTDGTATISPTGEYIAFVTKRLYSVQDIVVISQ